MPPAADAIKVVMAGEAMLELSRAGVGWALGHGGDTLNTALHLARNGVPTAYLTALGTDGFSDNLLAAWATEGLDCRLVLRHPDRQPGLYAITVDEQGERSFGYWRGESAARALFDCPGIDAALAAAAGATLFGFSLISLAVLPPEGRERLLALACAVRTAGGQVAFDGNYRPRLWPNQASARAARDAAIAVADIGLPTLEDEMALDGATDAAAVAGHWQRLGCAETVVKLGAEGCRLPDGTLLPPPQPLVPLDSSGAGDAFNAGYLAARLSGLPPLAAAAAGHQRAAWVVMRAGAIPPRDAAYPVLDVQTQA
jgi:2-dehydro-3-deoxygluconokinase